MEYDVIYELMVYFFTILLTVCGAGCLWMLSPKLIRIIKLIWSIVKLEARIAYLTMRIRTEKRKYEKAIDFINKYNPYGRGNFIN